MNAPPAAQTPLISLVVRLILDTSYWIFPATEQHYLVVLDFK
jgi:hypothetical protein